MSEQHAAGADRAADEAFADNPVADRSRRVVPTAGGNRDSRRESEIVRDVRSQPAGGVGALEDLGQPLGTNFQRLQDFSRPAAGFEIEKQGSRRVGGVGCLFARELEADVILGQQDGGQSSIGRRLLVAKPQQFRRLESSQGGVAGDLDEAARAHTLGDRFALGCGSLVVPQQSRPDDLISAVEKNRAVHLAREADAFDVPPHPGRDLGDHLAASLPPVLGLLLRPSRPRGIRRVFHAGGGLNNSLFVNRDAADAGGADIQSEEITHVEATASTA